MSYGWRIGVFAVVVVFFIIVIAVCIYLVVGSNNAVSNQRNNMPIVVGPPPKVSSGDWKPVKINPECCRETDCCTTSICDETKECTTVEFEAETCEEIKDESFEIVECEASSCDTCRDKCESSCNKQYTSGCLSPCDSIITSKSEDMMNPIDFYTAKNLKLLNIPGLPPNQIKDITQRGSIVVALDINLTTLHFIQLYNGKPSKIYQVKSKIAVSRIVFFRGDLYALNGGILYAQDPGSIGKRNVYWYKVEGVPENIVWITTSTNDDYLWIQTSDNGGVGTLYNCKLCPIETTAISTNTIRIYGSCPEQKADINTNNNELFVYVCKKLYQNVGMAIFNCQDEILFVRPEVYPSVVKGMRLINGCIYYLLVS